MFREDKRHGHGNFIWPDGAAYEGYVGFLLLLCVDENFYSIYHFHFLIVVFQLFKHAPHFD